MPLCDATAGGDAPTTDATAQAFSGCLWNFQGNEQQAAGGLAVVSALPNAQQLLEQILAQVQQQGTPTATQNLGKAVASASGKGANNNNLANALNQVRPPLHCVLNMLTAKAHVHEAHCV
jgi:hypothetical protein